MTTLKEMIKNEYTFEPYDFETGEIMGIPLHTKHFSFAPCVHIRIVFRYGAMHDEIGKEGVAHFLEHMLFKGNYIYEDEKAIKNFNKDILLNTHNAHTGLFELVIKGSCLPHNFEKAIEGIFAMVHSSKHTHEAYEQEKKVITQEAWRRYLNEKQIAYLKKYRAIKYQSFPDRLRICSPLGWPDTIEKITQEDIVQAYKKYFVRENIEIILGGNLNTLGSLDDIKKTLEKEIIKIPKGEKAILPLVLENIETPTQHIFDNTYTDIGLTEKNQTNLSIVYPLPRHHKKTGEPITDYENKDIATGLIAARLIGDIVYEKLRIENSWCYSAGSSAQLSPDYYEFEIKAQLNIEHVDEAIEIILQILEDIKNGHYEEKFNQRKRLMIESTIASENQTVFIVNDIIDDLIKNNTIVKERDILIYLEGVLFSDVKNMIAEKLTSERRLVETIRPSEKK